MAVGNGIHLFQTSTNAHGIRHATGRREITSDNIKSAQSLQVDLSGTAGSDSGAH
jgi:hypothetical protein